MFDMFFNPLLADRILFFECETLLFGTANHLTQDLLCGAEPNIRPASGAKSIDELSAGTLLNVCTLAVRNVACLSCDKASVVIGRQPVDSTL